VFGLNVEEVLNRGAVLSFQLHFQLLNDPKAHYVAGAVFDAGRVDQKASGYSPV
jgi:hypothetical protein